MKYLICLFSISFCSIAFSNADKAQHYNQLFKRQELIHKSYQNVYLTMTDINKREAIKSWFRLFTQTPEHIKLYNDISSHLSSIIRGKDYRLLLFYYTATGQIDQAKQVLGFYFISANTLIDNAIYDPQINALSPDTIQEIKSFYSPLDIHAIKQMESCFYKRLKNSSRGFDLNNLNHLERNVYQCAFKKTWVQNILRALDTLFIQNNLPIAPFPISFAGYIGGNSVDLHNQVPMDSHTIANLGQQLNHIQTQQAPHLNKAYSELSIEEFKSLMPSPQAAIDELFTRAEGFQNTTRWESLFDVPHTTLGPISSERLGIYGTMLEAIRNAQESVFIDIFWMGGSIGMNLAKELFRKVADDPEFTVVIISDNENKFSYGPELDMIYNYMRAFSEKFTQLNFYITPAHIGLKRTALPEFVDLLVTNSVVNDFTSNNSLKSFLEDDGFHLLAKSDHTKVMIVDGKNPELGKAFVGSKNWTDSSGGVNFDEVAEIEGPATALILNSFYYDILEAFLLDTHSDLGGSMVKSHIEAKHPNWPKRKAIERLLEDIDVTNRHLGGHTNVAYVEKGDAVVAPTQNNIYGTEMSALEQNIQVILSAKHQILIDDQFLYDPNVIEALKVAKAKNGVEVYIILESLLSVDQKGHHIPNNLFIPELVDMGVKVKWQKTPKTMIEALLNDQKKHPNQIITATFHMKSLAVDGVLSQDWQSCNSETVQFSELNNSEPVLITGSANKDIMTMSGGFREYQVAIYDPKTVASHDCLFWARWHNPSITHSTDGLDFDLPEQAEQLGIKDKQLFLSFLKQVLFAPYRFTKDFF